MHPTDSLSSPSPIEERGWENVSFSIGQRSLSLGLYKCKEASLLVQIKEEEGRLRGSQTCKLGTAAVEENELLGF